MPRGKVPPPVAGGVYAALATPLRPDTGEPDVSAFLDYIDKVSDAGVDGLAFFGATGEFVHFSPDDRMRLASLGVKRSRLPVLLNVSHCTLLSASELLRHAVNIGVSGVLLMPPYFYRYRDDQIARFYEDFLEVAGGIVPIYLYNLPQFTNPISVELAERLLASGHFAGIKDSSGDWESFKSLRTLQERHPFQLMLGNEGIYLQGLLAGANGAVSGVAAAIPELPVAIQKAVQSGDIAKAEQLSAKLSEFLAWIDKFASTVAIKEVAQARGWLKAAFAVPLSQTDCAERDRFREWLSNWLPEVLDSCSAALGVRT